MRFLIAGLGSIGRRHLRNLQQLGERDVLLFRTHRATISDDELSGFKFYTNLEEALAEKPDAVIISNPTALHNSVALPASATGCHLLIEKPVSHDLEGLSQLRKNLSARRKQALVGYDFRFHPVFRQIKTLLESGDFGRPLFVHAHWGEYLPDWHPWENYRNNYAARADLGGGVALTLSHPLDYLRWLFGDVTSVSARLAHISSLELSAEDHADFYLQFASGCLGSVHLDYYQKPPAHWLEITLEGGLIRWNYSDGSATVFCTKTELSYSLTPPDGFERNDLFLAEMKHFMQVCKGDEQPVCTLADGIRVVEIVLAARRSSEQNSQRIDLTHPKIEVVES